MVVYSCKKCGEPNYLTPHAFWDISDFGAKCEKCETINTKEMTRYKHRLDTMDGTYRMGRRYTPSPIKTPEENALFSH